MIDSYIGDELLVETNHDVLHHLENCPDCRQELAEHRNLRSRLRSAVKNSPEMQINPAFAANLQANLRETARRSKWWEIFSGNKNLLNIKLMSAAALSLLVFAGAAAVWLKYQKSQPDIVTVAENRSSSQIGSNTATGNLLPSPSPVIQAVRIAWRGLTAFAAGDHENCALQFRLAEKPVTLEEASTKYGKFNKDLDKAVINPLREIFPENTSGEIKLLESHSCVFEGRRFAHIVLRRRDHVISVLVTGADLSDKIDEKMVSQNIDNLQIAGFRTKHYAVFIVSDLPAAENSAVTETITASVRQHIEKFES